MFEIIFTYRKSILIGNNNTSVKTRCDYGILWFCTKMQTEYIYIFDTLGRILSLKNIGLYKDDGLIFIPNSNGPKHLNCKRKLLGDLDD